jgi:transposase
MWLTGRLVPDHKTIADFRKANGVAIRKICARFVTLCREMGLLSSARVAIDGSTFKAVNNRDRNVTRAKLERRRAQIEESVARYLQQLDPADRQEPSDTLVAKTTRLKEKIARLGDEMRRLAGLADIAARMLAVPDQPAGLAERSRRALDGDERPRAAGRAPRAAGRGPRAAGRGSGVVGSNVQGRSPSTPSLI